MKLSFLGTSGALATDTRQHLSLLLETPANLILVDCSGTPLQSMLKTGCNLDMLSDVILTHAHVDHLYALPSLLHSLWYRRYRYRPDTNSIIRLHALKETLEVAESLIRAFEIRKKPTPLSIEPICVDPELGETLDIQCDEYQLGVFRVKHGTIPSVGLYIDKYDGKRLLYSADSTICETLEAHLTPNTTTLIQECGAGIKGDHSHAGAEDVNRFIVGTAIDTVYLVHLPVVTPEELDDMVERVGRGFSGRVIVPNDGDFVIF